MLSLASRYRPDSIIFSVFPDDINRCELSERGSTPKPYFVLSPSNDLVLVKDHLPPVAPRVQPDLFRAVLGYSLFAHTVMSAVAPEYWLQGPIRRSTRVHSAGAAVTCRIFEKLKDFSQREKVKIFILIQYEKDEFENDLRVIDEVITCVDQDAVRLVDLRTPLAAVKKHNPGRYRRLFRGHMTREGNDFVAAVLREAISRDCAAGDHRKSPVCDRIPDRAD